VFCSVSWLSCFVLLFVFALVASAAWRYLVALLNLVPLAVLRYIVNHEHLINFYTSLYNEASARRWLGRSVCRGRAVRPRGGVRVSLVPSSVSRAPPHRRIGKWVWHRAIEPRRADAC
jgi:hypothetical protein